MVESDIAQTADSRETVEDSTDTSEGTDEASPTADTDEKLTRDDIFHVLQCRRRRLVLKYLQEYDGDGPARMGDIAEHIAAVEHDTTVEALQSQERQRVYIALYQSHLSKMDKVGVLDYNQSRGYVEPTPLADRFTDYIDREPSLLGDESETYQDRASDAATADITDVRVSEGWHKRYLYAAGASLVVASALSSGLLSSPFPTQFGMGILVSVLFVLLATSHWVTESAETTTPSIRSSQD